MKFRSVRSLSSLETSSWKWRNEGSAEREKRCIDSIDWANLRKREIIDQCFQILALVLSADSKSSHLLCVNLAACTKLDGSFSLSSSWVKAIKPACSSRLRFSATWLAKASALLCRELSRAWASIVCLSVSSAIISFTQWESCSLADTLFTCIHAHRQLLSASNTCIPFVTEMKRWAYLSLSDSTLQLSDLSQHHVLIGQNVVQLLGDLVLGFTKTQGKRFSTFSLWNEEIHLKIRQDVDIFQQICMEEMFVCFIHAFIIIHVVHLLYIKI